MSKKLFASVTLTNENTKGELNYYLTENKTYGLEIVSNFSGEEKEIKTINNITESLEKINKVLHIMSKEFVKPCIAEEILEDLDF